MIGRKIKAVPNENFGKFNGYPEICTLDEQSQLIERLKARIEELNAESERKSQLLEDSEKAVCQRSDMLQRELNESRSQSKELQEKCALLLEASENQRKALLHCRQKIQWFEKAASTFAAAAGNSVA